MHANVNSTQRSTRGVRALYWALIAFVVFRVLWITPAWVMGTPPAYPGEFQARLLGSIPIVGIMGALLVAQSPVRGSTRGRLAYWALLGVAWVGIALELWVAFTNPAT